MRREFCGQRARSLDITYLHSFGFGEPPKFFPSAIARARAAAFFPVSSPNSVVKCGVL